MVFNHQAFAGTVILYFFTRSQAGTTREENRTSRSVPGWVIAVLAILGVVVLVALFGAHNASMQASNAEQNLDNKIKSMQQDFTTQSTDWQQRHEQATTAINTLQTALDTVTKKERTQQHIRTHTSVWSVALRVCVWMVRPRACVCVCSCVLIGPRRTPPPLGQMCATVYPENFYIFYF